MAGLSQRLFALGRPHLERQLAHPTVRGIATGDLDPAWFRAWLVQDYLFLLDYVRLFALGRPNLERQFAHPLCAGSPTATWDQTRFRAWLVQDYLFLLDYIRLFALAAARAPDTNTLGRLVDLAHSTFHQELSLHRGYAAEFGLGEADLDRAEKSPVCAAYTDFLLRTAATADFAEVLAALLPCMWGYSELGRALAAKGLPAEPRYGRWIETYADPEFAGLAAWCAALLDRAADGLPAARLAACERAFLTSLRHELAFWDV